MLIPFNKVDEAPQILEWVNTGVNLLKRDWYKIKYSYQTLNDLFVSEPFVVNQGQWRILLI